MIPTPRLLASKREVRQGFWMISLAEKGLSKLKWMKTSGQLWLDPLLDLFSAAFTLLTTAKMPELRKDTILP